jgi:hypothetical protein
LNALLGRSVPVAVLAIALLPALATPSSAQSDCPNIVDGVDQCAYAQGLPGQDYDSDWDGATDSSESLFGTDPYDPDTDGDRLRDGDEYADRYGRADPTLYDTDGDGLGDGYEVFQNNSDPQLWDTDGDRVNDAADYAPRDPYVS